MKMIETPAAHEFAENEPALAWHIPRDGLLLDHLAVNFQNTRQLILSLTEAEILHKYAEDKWTVKEIIAHLIDMERVYSYRMLVFARNDKSNLPAFDDRLYIRESNANSRSAQELMDELESVRKSTIALLNGFTRQALMRSGSANGARATVRALAYHIAGHEVHHVNIIKEKYLCH